MNPSLTETVANLHLEPIDGATGNESGKPERPVPEFFTDRREAEDDVEVVLDAVDEELHHVLRRRRRFRRLPLDDGQQLGDDFTLLISSEKVRDQAWDISVVL